jgi:hypothetical protein
MFFWVKNMIHDDGEIGGTGDSWKQYAKSGDIIFDATGGLGAGIALRLSPVPPISPSSCKPFRALLVVF